jgi:hypothetical protein
MISAATIQACDQYLERPHLVVKWRGRYDGFTQFIELGVVYQHGIKLFEGVLYDAVQFMADFKAGKRPVNQSELFSNAGGI